MEEKYMHGEITEAEFDSLEGVAELSLESYLMRVYEEFPSRSNIEEEMAREELIKVVAEAIKSELDEKERLIITLRYYEGLAFKEIAHILDISPSRVSQLHTKALMKLKNYVKERYKGWVPY
jgi:RNA polymerase sigma factor (sigma-70 family)